MKSHKDMHIQNAVPKNNWIVLIFIMIILSSLYIYTDIEQTTASGLNVWYSFFEGKLNSFYNYKYPGVPDSLIPDGVTGGAYDFFIYVLFAIYNFPMWIWEKITGLSVFEKWITRFYIKGILFLFTAFSCYWIYKIALQCELNKKRAELSVFLFLSSGLFFYSVIVTGGYDIISVSFSLAGIYSYMKKNDRCFILSFAIAIATKLFALWLFIPLLLLREKRIWKISIKGIEALSLIIIPKVYFIIFGSGPEGSRTVNRVIAHSNLIDEFLFPPDGYQSALVKLNGTALLFVIMFVIWIYCYFFSKELKNCEIIYLCMLTMSTFFLTAIVHPYWIILLLPYLALIMSFKEEYLLHNLLLEILMSIGYIFRMYVLYPWCGSLNLIYYMLYPKSLTEYAWSDTGSLVMQNLGLGSVITKVSDIIGISREHLGAVFGALFLAAVCIFIYLNVFQHSKPFAMSNPKSIKSVYYIRLIISVIIGLFPFVGYAIWAIYS